MEVPIILASASPRRIELLQLIVPIFDVFPANVDESIEIGLTQVQVAEYLAAKKARFVAEKFPESLIIGADTIVCPGKTAKSKSILGKPTDYNHAVKMLKLLSGNTHRVITGVCLARLEKILTFHETTFVTFREISDAEIADYVNSGEPFDKAGGYGIQGGASKFASKIDGDITNVVGLPVARFRSEMKAFCQLA